MINHRDKLSHVSVENVPSCLRKELENESHVAIAELVEDSVFELIGRDLGPYQLSLSKDDTKFVLRISCHQGSQIATHMMSFRTLQRIIKDYKQICEALGTAKIGGLHPHRLEAIDMARRALHNEGASLLRERISSKVSVDFETARRLFTLVSVSMMGR
ncbi:MAG: UPF0262 family protein [Shinella sp.]|nr:UPF0262 family protein [Shinella sp.]